MKKDSILFAVQAKTPFAYETIEQVYEITKSYDAILELNEIALKYNVDIVSLAQYLYRK